MTKSFANIAGSGLAAAFLVAASAAHAEHAHYIQTPGTTVEDVAKGQTDKAAGEPGGHKFHENVHLGVPGSGVTPSGREGVGTTVDKNPVTIGKTSDL